MRIAIPMTVLVTALACSLVSVPAHARARVFVASYGNDSNPCTFGSPCKTFQQAVNVVDAGGEVTAIDSAGFGPITINKAITITSPNGVEAGIVPAPGGDAIDINAGPNDAVQLEGLHIDGSGVGSNGIVFNSGRGLTVTNCVVQNFHFSSFPSGNGIFIAPASGTASFAITNTTASNNGGVGIFFSQTGSATLNGILDHVVANNNSGGIAIQPSVGPWDFAISNSIVSNNSDNGIIVANLGTGPLTVSIDNTTANSNLVGISGQRAATVLLNRSVIQGNDTGIQNATTNNSFFTYGNNAIDFNTGINESTPLNTLTQLR